MSIFHDQYEFLQAGDVETKTTKAEALASTLIEEEFNELMQEPLFLTEKNVKCLKEALDLIYVTAQYLNVTIGPDKAEYLWDKLHQNNMSKCINGKLVKRPDGKVLKPEGYKKFDIDSALLEFDHNFGELYGTNY